MSTQDIKQLLSDLKGVSDSSLKTELVNRPVDIDDDKFHIAFSAYGLAGLLSKLPQEVIRDEATKIQPPQLEAIRWAGVFMLTTYVSLVYMRSKTLETGLDSVPQDSPLRPFRDVFRRGTRGEETIVQYMRNALAHGTFKLSNDCRSVTFEGRKWEASFSTKDVFSLCDEVYRFYRAAFLSKL